MTVKDKGYWASQPAFNPSHRGRGQFRGNSRGSQNRGGRGRGGQKRGSQQGYNELKGVKQFKRFK
eukprot:Pgem_evm1s19252